MIVGPTASGKSTIAMGVARQVEGAEIVALDSMQVYRGMDIGTATPTAAEKAEVPHHLIDLVEVSEEFAVAEFQVRAAAVIDDIRRRGAGARAGRWNGSVRPGRDRWAPDPRSLPGGVGRPGGRAGHRDPASAPGRSRPGRGRPDGAGQPAPGRQSPRGHHRQRAAVLVVRSGTRPLPAHAVRPGRPALGPRPAGRAHCSPLPAPDGRGLPRRGPILGRAADLPDRVAGSRLQGAARPCFGARSSLDDALELAVVRTRRFARRQERWFRRDPRIHWLDAPTTPADVLSGWKCAAARALPTQGPSRSACS